MKQHYGPIAEVLGDEPIQAGYDSNWHPTRVKITNNQSAAVPLEPHKFHGERKTG